MYIGLSLKKKLVVLMGPTSIAEIELYGYGPKIYSKLPCLCCYKRRCTIKPNCMDLISVEKVFDAVKDGI
jgi:ADP-heptose:LPS heptosyltransferase